MPEFTEKDHTFAVCAYGESRYLTHCLDSLMAQEKKSSIIISTSTPNEHIKRISQSYGLEIRVNTQPSPPGIAGDWNFAYKQAGTRLITLAHQDDIYLPGYLSTALEMLNNSYKPIIFFSHYAEIKGSDVYYSNTRLNIKKLMAKPLKVFRKSRFVRRRILSLGNVICCPSVMYVDIESIDFSGQLMFCLDWQKWEELSLRSGSFVYCEKPLLHHRLHAQAQTAKAIQGGLRRQEDYIMFRKFWWVPIARVLTMFYTKSEIDQ